MLPTLLNFPPPPSYTPSPSTSSFNLSTPTKQNPPPTGPPISPLPPVPGPSRISESDTLLFLSASRRSSKFSVASTQESVTTNRSESRQSRSSSLSSHSHSFTPSAKPVQRPVSPDISTLLSQTPKPPRRSRPASSASQETWEEGQFIDDYRAVDITQLEDTGSDSDSSLDLHTPLPHIMLRHGLLSPNSKLLTSSSTTLSVQPSAADSRPGSVFSVASNADSVVTKSGVMKDSRDTPRRRTRHRDGKLLKGGIGLTTGLGWSDSEDEDAPSALTRKISHQNLARRSVPSLRSSFRSSSYSHSSHPLTRSYSKSTVFDDDDDDVDDFASNTYSGHSISTRSKTPRSRAHSHLPPTAWGKKASGARLSTRSSDSGGSTYSLALSITSSSRDNLTAIHNIPKSPHRLEEIAVRTPSTASSLSFTLPVTPQDDAPMTKNLLPLPDREKMLPSLPNPRTGSIRRYASHANLKSPASLVDPSRSPHASVSAPVGQRRRSQSSASSGSPPGQQEPRPSPSSGLPRSLRLSSRLDAVPVPPLPPSIRYSQQRSTLRSAATAPTTPTGQTSFTPRVRVSDPLKSSISPFPAGIPVPRKPRTGTGMVYRSGSTPSRQLVTGSNGIGIAL